MTTLQRSLIAIDLFLAHCQQHLDAHDWKILTRRLVGTPLEQGYSVQERWTARQMVEYYGPRLSDDEWRTVVRKQRLARRRARKEVAP
jgi:hypothetical protein